MRDPSHRSGPPHPEWFSLEPGVVYLNHGSFGPPPRAVSAARQAWLERMNAQPMEFFVRQLLPGLEAVREKLGAWLGVSAGDLVLQENATAAMNVVASSLKLAATDNVVLNDHEYGAVQRIWSRACGEAGAAPPRVAQLPPALDDAEEIVESILAHCDDHTRLIVVSHITSPTAVILPVAAICERAARLSIPVCVDGPHALAQLPLNLADLGCAYYTASCHKWLSAPFGTGFLYVAPQWQSSVRPPLLSWGRLPPEQPASWGDEFAWTGTRDATAWLAIGSAIDFLATQVGWGEFRDWSHGLAQSARHLLLERLGTRPLTPDSSDWYAGMALVPLPASCAAVDAARIQQALRVRAGIEVPIVPWKEGCLVRVSCHLYNSPEQLQQLVTTLHAVLT